MNYPTIVDGIDFKELVFITNNDPVTDSFMVAKAFRKRHDNVVRDVERTIAACPEEFDTKLNFEVCYKNNELQNGKPQKFYRLRKDGLMLLVMSYTKKEAMRIKIAYINAFNWMYAMLQVGHRLRMKARMTTEKRWQLILKKPKRHQKITPCVLVMKKFSLTLTMMITLTGNLHRNG